MPVNIREGGDEGGGNKVAVLMASMGTHVADPVLRLEAVMDSTSQAKKQMAGLGQLPALAYSGYLLAPGLAQTVAAIAGVKNPLPTTFNLVLSNVPGPKKTLYLRGSRLEAVYPVSIPAHGMALNITLETYADTMNFGFIGDREAVPHLQRLAVYTGEALAALEQGLGLPSDAANSDVSVAPEGAPNPGEKPGAGRSSATRAALAKPAKKSAAKRSAAKKSTAEEERRRRRRRHPSDVSLRAVATVSAYRGTSPDRQVRGRRLAYAGPAAPCAVEEPEWRNAPRPTRFRL